MKFNNKNNENTNDIENDSIRKDFLEDNDGNLSIIVTSLLLIGFLILSIIILNTAISQENENKEVVSSNNYQYILDDYIRNLPLIEHEAMN